jgi:hypothetical protein
LIVEQCTSLAVVALAVAVLVSGMALEDQLKQIVAALTTRQECLEAEYTTR